MKLTKEQKEGKKLKDNESQIREMLSFYSSLPARVLQLIAEAQSEGIETVVSFDQRTYKVSFSYRERDTKNIICIVDSFVECVNWSNHEEEIATLENALDSGSIDEMDKVIKDSWLNYCELISDIDSVNYMVTDKQEKRHKEEELHRKKQGALAKLTSEERKILGF